MPLSHFSLHKGLCSTPIFFNFFFPNTKAQLRTIVHAFGIGKVEGHEM